MIVSSLRHCLPLAALLLAVLAFGCRSSQPEQAAEPEEPSAAAPAPEVEPQVSSEALEAARRLGTAGDEPVVNKQSGLSYIDVKTGEGVGVLAGRSVAVHYTGWLVDGTKFDSSHDRGEPFGFTVGAGRVIPGWDQGLVGMQPGGVRKLIIPPQLGYGSRGSGDIPPDATLVFEVELLEVE